MDQSIENVFLVVMTLATGFARMYGLLLIFPLFTFLELGGILRFGLAIALSLPVFSLTALPGGDLASNTWVVLALVLKELALGCVLGLALGLPIWAMQASGDMIEFYRGGAAADQFDPINAAEETPGGRLFTAMALSWFVFVDGPVVLFGLVYKSFTVWRIGELVPRFEDQALRLGLLVDRMIEAAIVVAGPLLIMLVLVDVITGTISRSAQNISLVDLTNTLKSLVVVACLPLYFMFFDTYANIVMKDFVVGILRLLGLDQ
jgi:type III secretion protein T